MVRDPDRYLTMFDWRGVHRCSGRKGCGALVEKRDEAKHGNFHRQLDKLMEEVAELRQETTTQEEIPF